ncbi:MULTISPECIES: hypothetical protein [unclassified Gilliamella]|uniref:hypothetical protein n=1 Tax=unclassified Gilliamella TaxID=2685620 RepID=UPI00226A61FE|nr:MULTISPECIES: hypothetical protein [unclassified Gilliamella]MCX8588842.1 hypothetical protein [Gilliamella sp. B3801]MCX8592643.1 hypothetical protein [Gilliamella sp. B3804]
MLYSKIENAFYVGDELDINIPDDVIDVNFEIESEIRKAVINGVSFEILDGKIVKK